MLDRRVESFSRIKRKPALEEAEGPMTRAKILMRFVEQSRHRQIKYSEGNRFGRAGDNRKRRAFSRFKFQIHSRGARSVRRLSRRWCVRLFRMIRLKSSV